MSTVFTCSARHGAGAKTTGGHGPTNTPPQSAGRPAAVPAAAASPTDATRPTARERAQQLAEASGGRVHVAETLAPARRALAEALRLQLAEAPSTREECEEAARQRRFTAIAPPAAWRDAVDVDGGRHWFALELLRREVWGCYELHRQNERRLSECWRMITQVRDLLRLAVRGDPQQLVLFGLIGQGSEGPHE